MKRKIAAKNLDKIAAQIREHLGDKDAVRERCLKDCREIIRLSSTAIRAIHRKEKDQALKLIGSAELLVTQIVDDFAGKHCDLLHANYVHDAFKEYAEASITYGIICEKYIPDPDKLKVAYPAFLNGLAESVGELRRYLLDGLRQNDFSDAEDLLDSMDCIYSVLVTMDFPDAVTYGLRRNTDNVRGIVEKTRGDLTTFIHNRNLQQKINGLAEKLGNSTDLS